MSSLARLSFVEMNLHYTGHAARVRPFGLPGLKRSPEKTRMSMCKHCDTDIFYTHFVSPSM